MNYGNIPQSLKNEPHWVLWKDDKLPFSPNGHAAKANDPRTWSRFTDVVEAMETGEYAGIGFELGTSRTNPDINYTGFDLDNHIVGGKPTPFAKGLLERFPTFREISPSGTGLHFILIGKKPGVACELRQEVNPDGTGQKIEIYGHTRYFTMTGNCQYGNYDVHDCQSELDTLYHQLFPPQPQRPKPNPKPINLSDQELLERAYNARNGGKIKKLMEGDASDYPLDTGKDDHSAADLALCNHLAFWFGCDPVRMDTVFRSSGLMREKWDRFIPGWDMTYGEHTIDIAISSCADVYRPKKESNGIIPDDIAGLYETDGFDENQFIKKIEDAKKKEGKERRDVVNALLREILRLDALTQAEMLDKMAEEKLQPKGVLTKRLKELGNIGTDAVSIARSLIEDQFSNNGKPTIAFQHGSWYQYDGTKYQEISRDVYETSIVCQIVATGVDVTQQLVNSVRLASQPAAIIPDATDPPFWRTSQIAAPDTLSLQNGILDLPKLFRKKSAFSKHTSDFFTLSSQPYRFLPNSYCPQWLGFLDTALPDPKLIDVLQEFFGLCLTHDQRFQKFLFLQGQSRTGKGVAFEVLQALVGEDNVSNVPLRDFGGTFGLQPMLGKKLNINAEIPELDKVAEDVLKEYTGGNTMISYNRKNRESITTKQRARLAFSSNHYPTFTDRSEGLWNRLILIPFNVVCTKPNLDLAAGIIDKELSGVFNWAVEGYKRLLHQNDFTESQIITEEINDYRAESVAAIRFFEQYFRIQDDDDFPRHSTHGKTIYRYYQLYAKLEGRRLQGAVSWGRDVASYLKGHGIIPDKDRWGMTYPKVFLPPSSRQELVKMAKANLVIRDDVEWDFDIDEHYDTTESAQYAVL